MDRLTLPPKRHSLEGAGGLPAAGIPPGSLPKCATLPLDTKLPMVAGPKGSVKLFTTNLGERIHLSSQNLDFDLTDPYSMLMTNGYKPLHDPHLRALIKSPYMRRRLRKGGFITRDGKVLCTLKEFNEWRQYLRKIHLSLEKRHEKEQRDALDRELRLEDGGSTASVIRQKEERMREVRERINTQLEEDQQRYADMARADEERMLRIEEGQRAKRREIEQKYQKLQDRQISLAQKRQAEERRRQGMMVRKWMDEDSRRAEIIEDRKRNRQLQQEKKLAESWEKRKQMQQKHLDEENDRRSRDDQQNKQRISERERVAKIKLEQQQADLASRTEQRRIEREKDEGECNKRFQARLTRRLDKASKRKRANNMKGTTLPRIPTTKKRGIPQSNWNIEQTLLANFSDGEERLSLEDKDGGYQRNAITSGDDSPTGGLSPIPPVVEMADVLHIFVEGDDDDDSENAYPIFHGCILNDSATDLKCNNPHMNNLLAAENEVRLAASNCGLGDMSGAVFNPSIFDIETPAVYLSETSQAVSFDSLHESETNEVEAVAEMGLADFRGADITSTSQAEKDRQTVEALPAYAALAQEQAEQGAIPEREDGPNIRDIAKVMVGVSVYIASKVLCPAIKRYEEEQRDLPNVETSTKSSSASTPIERLGTRTVRFQLTPETIEFPESYEEEFYLDENEAVFDTRRESVGDEDGGIDSDIFVSVQGRDSLTKLRRNSATDSSNNDLALFQAGLKESMASGTYASYSTFTSGITLTTDRTRGLSNESLSIHADDEYEDDDFSPYSYTSVATAPRPQTSEVDVHLPCTSGQNDPIEPANRPSPPLPTSFSSMLHEMRFAYEKGVLSNAQIQTFMTYGMQMIQNAQAYVRNPPSPTPTCSTNTSIMADEAVRGALQRVQQDLFQQYGPTFGQDESLARQYASANALATIIAEKALGFAANSVLKFTKQMIASTEEVDKTPSKVVEPSKVIDCATVASELKVESISTLSTASFTSSEYIHDILGRVVKDIQNDLQNAPQTGLMQKDSNQTQSTAMNFIDDMLSRVADNTKETLQNSLKTSNDVATDSGLTDLVLCTLDEVIQSINNETSSSSNSDTAHLIRDIINQAADEIKANVTSTQWPLKYVGQVVSKDSLASILSDVVRRTLSTACHEIENEYGLSSYQSTTSIFCQELVNDTLQDCIENVRNGSLSPKEIGELAAAMVSSQQANSEDGQSQVQNNGSSTSLGQSSLRTSCLLDELISETLAKVTQLINEGKISTTDVSAMAETLCHGKIPSQKTSPRSSNSRTSTQMAEVAVNDKLAEVVNSIVKEYGRMSKPSEVPVKANDPTTEESLEAMEIVQSALANVAASSRPFSNLSNSTAQATAGSTTADSLRSPKNSQVRADVSSSHDLSQESLLDRFLTSSIESVRQHLNNNGETKVATDQEPLDELQLQPVLGGAPVDLDPAVVNASLLAISARDPLNSSPSEATPRNSFLSLTRPDISNVKVINHQTAETISKSLISISSKNLTEIIKNSVPLIHTQGPMSVPFISSIPRIRSTMIRSTVHNITMEEEPEEDSDNDSDSGDEGQFMGASECQPEFGNSLMTPNMNSVPSSTKQRKTSAPKSKPKLPNTRNESLSRSSTKVVTSAVPSPPTSSRDSLRRSSLDKPTTTTTVSKESVRRASTGSSANSPRSSSESLRRSMNNADNGTRPSSLAPSRESLRRSSTKIDNGAKLSPRSSNKLASKTNVQSSSHGRIPSRRASLDKRSPSTKSMQTPVTSKDKMRSTHSLNSGSQIATNNATSTCSLPKEEPQSEKKSSSRMLMLPRKSSPEVFIADDEIKSEAKSVAGSTTSLPPIPSRARKSTESTHKADSGRTIEMVSSGHHAKIGSGKNASSDSVGGNSKSSHKNMDLTPRPSSAFGKKSNNHISPKNSTSTATGPTEEDNLRSDAKSTTSLKSDKTV